jgi:hypothetical protein
MIGSGELLLLFGICLALFILPAVGAIAVILLERRRQR